MNKIRKLAVRGMRGRRKDTRVLALVIGMGFSVVGDYDAVRILSYSNFGSLC